MYVGMEYQKVHKQGSMKVIVKPCPYILNLLCKDVVMDEAKLLNSCKLQHCWEGLVLSS